MIEKRYEIFGYVAKVLNHLYEVIFMWNPYTDCG